MIREKQKLECEMAEMLEIIEKAREVYANDVTDHTENEYIREGFLDAGYRRQSEGEWEDQYQGMYANQLYKCSVCGETASHDDKRWFLTNFCPNCGAKMKGGAE